VPSFHPSFLSSVRPSFHPSVLTRLPSLHPQCPSMHRWKGFIAVQPGLERYCPSFIFRPFFFPSLSLLNLPSVLPPYSTGAGKVCPERIAPHFRREARHCAGGVRNRRTFLPSSIFLPSRLPPFLPSFIVWLPSFIPSLIPFLPSFLPSPVSPFLPPGGRN
jgi:hypothetical protein